MASVLERLESRTRKSQEVFKRTREVVAQEVVGTVDMPYPSTSKRPRVPGLPTSTGTSTST